MPSSMRGVSAGANLQLLEELKEGLSDDGGAGYDVAGDLFAVGAVLRSEPALRRVLTDPSIGGEAKADLVRTVFGDGLGDRSLDLLASAAGQRWAAMRHLGDTLEQMGVVAVVLAAEADGEADAVESQLFDVSRLVSDNHSLRDALSDPARSVEDKAQLLGSLLEGKVARGTLQLAEQAVSGTYRTVVLAIEAYQRLTARERSRMVALVRVARPLSAEETERLGNALSHQYGRQIELNELVDPDLLGGMRVEIGDDVIDGTVSSRLHEARRKLAG